MKEKNYDGSQKLKKPFPVLRKTGVIVPDGGEMSVFVYRGKLMMLQNEWGGTDGYPNHQQHSGVLSGRESEYRGLK